MLIFPEEDEDEIFLDIYLSEEDLRTLRSGKMLNEEIVNWMRTGKRICIGILNPPNQEQYDDEEEIGEEE
jgi:hypothetical protein